MDALDAIRHLEAKVVTAGMWAAGVLFVALIANFIIDADRESRFNGKIAALQTRDSAIVMVDSMRADIRHNREASAKEHRSIKAMLDSMFRKSN